MNLKNQLWMQVSKQEKKKQPGLNNQKPPKKRLRMPAVVEETRDLEAVVNVGTKKKEETNNKET